MQRVQDVFGACFVPVQLVGDVRFTMDRAPACQGHDLPVKRALYRFLDIEPHPAYLLHKELAASSGAFIVRKHIRNPSVCQEVHQEGLAAQRSDCVKIAPELGQSPLYGGNLGDMASTAGHPEPIGSAKLLPSKYFLEDLQGTSLMGLHAGEDIVPSQRYHLHCDRADVYAHATRPRRCFLKQCILIFRLDVQQNSPRFSTRRHGPAFVTDSRTPRIAAFLDADILGKIFVTDRRRTNVQSWIVHAC